MTNFLNGSVRSKGFLSLLIAVSAMLAAGCDLSTGEVNASINDFNQVRNPVGHIQGIVVDSNGVPLQNATVTIGSRQMKTNSGGSYEFRNVEVVNATTNNYNSGDNDTDHPSLKIVVTPPAVTNASPTAHLGAIVTVYPEAQFNETNQQFNDENQASETTGSQSVFIDGFRIQAEDAVLPELTSDVEVLALRDSATGALVPAGTSVTLDYVGVSNTDGQEPDSDESSIIYPTVSWSGTTDANGTVSFSNVAANSDFRFHVNGYDCDSSGDSDNADESDTCYVSTENETNVVTYENFALYLLADQGDEVNPHVVDVTGVYDTLSEPADTGPDSTECDDGAGLASNKIAKLGRGVTGASGAPFRIQLNEAIVAANVSTLSVVIYDATAGEYVKDTTNGAAAASGSTVTVSTAAAVPPGHEISVYMFRPDFVDISTNANVIGVSSDINYDCLGAITPAEGSGTSFVALDLELFAPAGTNVAVGDIAADQVADDPVETLSDNDLAFNQALSTAFIDGHDSGSQSNDISQMNFDNIDSDTLYNRRDAFGSISGVGETSGDIWTNNARIEFTPAENAQGYIITRNGSNDISDVSPADFDETYLTDPTDNSVDGDTLLVHTVTRDNVTLYAFTIRGSDSGDVVTITPYATDDLGHMSVGNTASVVLADVIEPTVTVQQSYRDYVSLSDFSVGGANQNVDDDASGDNISGCWNSGNTTGPDHAGVALESGSSRFGDGGELSAEGADQAVGNLCLGASPELLVDSDQSSDSVHPELEAGRAAAFDASGANSTNYPRAYDAAAFTAWTAASRSVRMGVAVTEDLADGVTAPAATPATTATLTVDSAPQNNTFVAHLDASPLGDEADLVTMVVSDALAFANSDHGKALDFTGDLADLAGNPASAGANAVLTVRDMWPPYVTSGSRDSAGVITLVFNEPVLIEDAMSLDITGTTVTLDNDNGDNDANPSTVTFTQSVDGMTITIDPTEGDEQAIDLTTAFPAAGDLSYPALTPVDHGVLGFEGVYDVRGNRWADHDYLTGDLPLFVMTDALAANTVGQTSSFTTTATATFTITLTATHPLANWVEQSDTAYDTDQFTDSGNTAIFDNASLAGCTEAAGQLTCTDVDTGIVTGYVSLGGAGACTAVVPAGSQAVFSASRLSVQFTVVCDATPTATDTVQLLTDGNDFESNVDGGEVANFVPPMLTKT